MDTIQKDFNNLGEQVVMRADLPIACPTPAMALWNAHPRIYLPIEATGKATCPYCGAHYILKEP